MLTEEHKHLYSIYQKSTDALQRRAGNQKRGVFFDLMYANIKRMAFSMSIKQYTFYAEIQKTRFCFFVINFDSQLVDVAINVPSHAFDFFADSSNGVLSGH